jgi:hypothetical protein
MEPDYNYYSLEELEDARRQIDIDRYPERHRALESELQRRRAGIGEAGRPARCLSCQGALRQGTVRPLLVRSIFVSGFVGEILIWGFSASVAVLFSLSLLLAGFFVGAVGVSVVLVYSLRSVEGYICNECGAQYAPWQIKN